MRQHCNEPPCFSIEAACPVPPHRNCGVGVNPSPVSKLPGAGSPCFLLPPNQPPKNPPEPSDSGASCDGDRSASSAGCGAAPADNHGHSKVPCLSCGLQSVTDITSLTSCSRLNMLHLSIRSSCLLGAPCEDLTEGCNHLGSSMQMSCLGQRACQVLAWLGEQGAPRSHIHHGGRWRRGSSPCEQYAQALDHGQKHASKCCRFCC